MREDNNKTKDIERDEVSYLEINTCKQLHADREYYLHPAMLSSRAYILPISPMPMMPMAVVSLLSTTIVKKKPAVQLWISL